MHAQWAYTVILYMHYICLEQVTGGSQLENSFAVCFHWLLLIKSPLKCYAAFPLPLVSDYAMINWQHSPVTCIRVTKLSNHLLVITAINDISSHGASFDCLMILVMIYSILSCVNVVKHSQVGTSIRSALLYVVKPNKLFLLKKGKKKRNLLLHFN